MVNLSPIITITATAVYNFGINQFHIPVPPTNLPALDVPLFGTTSVDTDTKTIPSEFLDSPVVEVVYDHIPIECAEDDFMCYSALAWNAFMIKSMKTYEKFISENIQHIIKKCTFDTTLHAVVSYTSVYTSNIISRAMGVLPDFNATASYIYRGATIFFNTLLRRPSKPICKSFSIKPTALSCYLKALPEKRFQATTCQFLARVLDSGGFPTSAQPREDLDSLIIVAFFSLVITVLAIIIIGKVFVRIQYSRKIWEMKMRNNCGKIAHTFWIVIVRIQYIQIIWQIYIRNICGKISCTYWKIYNRIIGFVKKYIRRFRDDPLNKEWEIFNQFIIETLRDFQRNGFVHIDVVQYLCINLPSDPCFDELRRYHEDNINMDVKIPTIKHHLLQTFCGDRTEQLFNNAQQKVCRNMYIVLDYMFGVLELYYMQRGQNIAAVTLKFDSVDVLRARWKTLREWKKFNLYVDEVDDFMKKNQGDIFNIAVGHLILHLPSDTYFDNWRQYHSGKLDVNVTYSSVKRRVLTIFHPDRTRRHFSGNKQEICNKLFKLLNHLYDKEESCYQLKNHQNMDKRKFIFLSIDELRKVLAEAAKLGARGAWIRAILNFFRLTKFVEFKQKKQN